jgi:thiamine biosynthesis lipoprotein
LTTFRAILLIALACVGNGCNSSNRSIESHLFHGETMGTTFSVKIVGNFNSAHLESLRSSITDTLTKIDEAMSTYREDSELSRFNQWMTTEPFHVSGDTLSVFQKALEISELTGGAFDITVEPLVAAWGFGPVGKQKKIPTDDELEKLLSRVGYDKLEIDPITSTIRKLDPLLSCDLSAIAKGFAVDRVSDLLENAGVMGYLVEIGGEIRASGKNDLQRAWNVAIERPGPGIPVVHRLLALRNSALATSGDYRNYYEIEGRRISHTIDPRTGQPVNHGLASVSVVAETCMEADAIATALEVLGAEDGYVLAIEQGWAVLLINRHADGTLNDRESPAFTKLISPDNRLFFQTLQ